MLEPVTLTCPYCSQPVETTVDLYAGSAEYVEDCQICCHPMRVQVSVAGDGSLGAVQASREDD